MMTSLFRRTLQYLLPAPARQASLPLCLPEWSDTMAEQQAHIWWKVKPYTKTGTEHIVALCQSIAYLENRHVPGAIVACGVGKGGSTLAAALALLALESTSRPFYLFDTFPVGTESSLEQIKQIMMQTAYPWEKMIFVPDQGKDILAKTVPAQIAFLHLDISSPPSTTRKFEQLYPRLAEGGVLIVDNHKPVDDFFRKQGIDAELQSIDLAGRFLVKKAVRQTRAMAA